MVEFSVIFRSLEISFPFWFDNYIQFSIILLLIILDDSLLIKVKNG